MELVDVPKYIPKEERNLFRDAMIAAHGGKILAALFYLRVFTEQFARRVTGETGRRYGDELMEDYGKTLPDPHRSTMLRAKRTQVRRGLEARRAYRRQAELV